MCFFISRAIYESNHTTKVCFHGNATHIKNLHYQHHFLAALSGGGGFRIDAKYLCTLYVVSFENWAKYLNTHPPMWLQSLHSVIAKLSTSTCQPSIFHNLSPSTQFYYNYISLFCEPHIYHSLTFQGVFLSFLNSMFMINGRFCDCIIMVAQLMKL